MRATLSIPDELVSEVQKISGEKSKTKAITVAMQEFIRQQRVKELIGLRGKIKIDYNWKKEEALELDLQNKREKSLE